MTVLHVNTGNNVQRARQRLLARYHNDELSDFMNGAVRKHVGIIPEGVTWGGQSQRVFDALSGDFMVPAIGVVDALLAAGELSPDLEYFPLSDSGDRLFISRHAQQILGLGYRV